MANTLFLRLEGPLQSWGVRAHWEERDTAFEPTKSGVIGLIGCALGLRRDDDRLRELSEAFRLGVRVDRPGSLLVDYHTTGGAKAADGEPEGMLNAQGKLKRETDVSTRRYLMDASFLVALRGSDADVAACAEGLQHPVWPVFLGRKACVPTEPVFAGIGDYESLEAALKAHPLPERVIEAAREPTLRLRLVIECDPGEGNARNDAIGVPARRLFWPRYVDERFASFAAPSESTINTFEV
ncbi:MAG TPA: type I-E CRISPR-associated protein Cas5/CasD [Herpetosiphonaceae bacterium]